MEEKHHGREYFFGGIGAVAEYLALRYGMNWLAWLAAFLLWLAVVEYTRRWASRRAWIYAGWFGLFVAMSAATYYLIGPKPAGVLAARAPIQQSTAPPDTSTPPAPIPSAPQPKPKVKATPKKVASSSSPIQDNSTHVEGGSKIEQSSGGGSGNCNPNFVGGSNTVNCAPPPPPPTEIRYTQEPTSSLNASLPQATKVVVQITYPVSPVSLVFVCDVDVQEGDYSLTGVGGYRANGTGYINGDKKLYWIFWGDPPFRPETPLTVTLMSDRLIHVLAVKRGPQAPLR